MYLNRTTRTGSYIHSNCIYCPMEIFRDEKNTNLHLFDEALSVPNSPCSNNIHRSSGGVCDGAQTDDDVDGDDDAMSEHRTWTSNNSRCCSSYRHCR